MRCLSSAFSEMVTAVGKCAETQRTEETGGGEKLNEQQNARG